MVTANVTANVSGKIIEWREGDTSPGCWYYKDNNQPVGEYDLILINILIGIEGLKHIRENPISHFPDNTSIADDATRRVSLAITKLEEAEFWLHSIRITD